LMSMLLCESAFEAVRQMEGDCISVKGTLRLILSSAYGKAQFGSEAAIEAQDFSAKVDQAFDELRPRAASDKIDEFKDKMEGSAAYAATQLPMTRTSRRSHA